MTVVVHEEAYAEAHFISTWYEERSPGLGTLFLQDFDSFMDTLARMPRMFGRVDRTPIGREVRLGMLGRFPFRVHYEVALEEICVLSLAHASRKISHWRRRLT